MDIDIDMVFRKYMLSSLLIMVLLTGAVFVIVNVIMQTDVTVAVVISVLFSISIELADVLLWKHIAKSSPDSLTTFYSAISGIRMLLALGTMLVYYLVAPDGGMTSFFVVFLIYYFVVLGHHAIFFARLTNSGKLNKL